LHLSIGQEAPAAAFSLVTKDGDYAVSTHRSHAHYLAKGGNLKSMIAELYGKATGCSRGIGGSMHLIDTTVGFMGSSAIVGNSIPVGVGLAFALQYERKPFASIVFLGDGATEEGVFYESLNFAALKNLPVLFFCENNQYSVYSPIQDRQPPTRDIVNVARSLGARARRVDGHSAPECLLALTEELPGIREGAGPILIEFMTHRYLEHCGPNDDDQLGYRQLGELASWQSRDPIDDLRKKVSIDEIAMQERVAEIEKEISEAFEEAKSAPYLRAEDLQASVYAG